MQHRQAVLRSTLMWACLLLDAGCHLPALDFDSKACPCVEGWTCDTSTNLCVRGGPASASQPSENVADASALPVPLGTEQDASHTEADPDAGEGVFAQPDGGRGDAGSTGGGEGAPDAGEMLDGNVAQKTCAEVDCGGHALCQDSDAGAVCACEPGFADDNQDGTCTPSCATAVCGESQVCVAYSDAVRCMQERASCAAILAADPSATSGPYAIDPDGVGGSAPMMVDCEMDAQGRAWTQVVSEGFESGFALGWSDGRVDTTSDCADLFGFMLGGLGLFGEGAQTSKTFSLRGVPHAEIRVSVGYVAIDSWDDESAQVLLDGDILVDKRLSPAIRQQCGGGWPDTGRVRLWGLRAHHSENARLTITSNLDSDALDESFGFTDVKVWVR